MASVGAVPVVANYAARALTTVPEHPLAPLLYSPEETEGEGGRVTLAFSSGMLGTPSLPVTGACCMSEIKQEFELTLTRVVRASSSPTQRHGVHLPWTWGLCLHLYCLMQHPSATRPSSRGNVADRHQDVQDVQTHTDFRDLLWKKYKNLSSCFTCSFLF